MVKFKVALKDLLGKAYYQYELSMSSTNVTTGNNVTATVTVKNILGNPVSNKELELFYKGTSQGTQTTNELGMATWTITTSNLGLAKITIGGTNTYNYINVTDGWHYVTVSNGTLYYNPTLRLCSLRYDREFNSGQQNTLYEWGQLFSSSIAHLKPKYMVTGSGNRNGATVTIDSDGYIYGRFQLAFSSTTHFYYHLMWHY